MVAVIVVLAVAFGMWAYLDFTNPFPTPDAAPAPVLDPQVPARAQATPAELLLCATDGHVTPDWAHLDGRKVCTRCSRLLPKGDDQPFDREAAELVAEAAAYLRGVA